LLVDYYDKKDVSFTLYQNGTGSYEYGDCEENHDEKSQKEQKSEETESKMDTNL